MFRDRLDRTEFYPKFQSGFFGAERQRESSHAIIPYPSSFMDIGRVITLADVRALLACSDGIEFFGKWDLVAILAYGTAGRRLAIKNFRA